MKLLISILAILTMCLSIGAQEYVEYSFHVDGTCEMCRERIEKTAIEQGKAAEASWSVSSKILTVSIDESQTSAAAVRHFLAEAGHDNGDYIAPSEVYDDLHSCCKYRPEDGNLDSSHGVQEGIIKSEGYVYGLENGNKIPLIGASITLEDGSAGTVSDADGHFIIDNPTLQENIVISYIGYNDQMVALGNSTIDVTLADGVELEEVEISYRRRTTEISFVNAINVENITRDELRKAACCNLSESFETNPSVDVSYSDAVTGTKQIQMLGLAGPYVQITLSLIHI